MNRIDRAFNELKSQNRTGLITFVTAGDPNLETLNDIVAAMEKAGTDIIELGIPYSDPLADGPVIQNSSSRSLKAGTTIKGVMEQVVSIRKTSDIPLVFMLYYSCVFKYGVRRFMAQCHEIGIDGVIIPDLPLEEREEINDICKEEGVYLIPMVAPTSKQRINTIVNEGHGFVYCVSVAGVTGMRNSISTDIDSYLGIVKEATDLPRALGFGISNKEMAEKYKKYCDAVIMGSAVVNIIDSYEDKATMLEELTKFISDVKSVL